MRTQSVDLTILVGISIANSHSLRENVDTTFVESLNPPTQTMGDAHNSTALYHPSLTTPGGNMDFESMPVTTYSASTSQNQSEEPPSEIPGSSRPPDTEFQHTMEQGNKTPSASGAQGTASSPQLIAQQQQMLARLRKQGTPLAPAHQVMMDGMDLPPAVLAQVGNQLRAPPEIRKWKDLRAWLHSNPAAPQVQTQLERVQRQQFAQYMQRQMERRNQAAQAQARAQQAQAQQAWQVG